MNRETALEMLDVDAMRPLLARVPAVADADGPVELVALWAKPGRHFNTHYRIGEIRVSAFLVQAARGAQVLAKAGAHTCNGREPHGCRACATHVVAPDLLIQLFPWDYRLPTLPSCLEGASVQREAPSLAVTSSKVVAYRPGMRCQIAYETADGAKVYGKVAVESRGAGYAHGVQQRVHAAIAPTVRLARPLAYIAPLSLTVTESVEGTSLHDLMDAGARPLTETRAAAGAIAELHRIGATEQRTYTPAEENELVAQWTALAGELFPHLARSLREHARELAAREPARLEPRGLLHRDFHDKQILFRQGDAPALLDMDTVAGGDTELDVANFCAHLRLRAIQHDRRELCTLLEEEFRAAYPGRLDPVRLDWYRRCALVRLACNYALRPRWRHIAERIIAAAEE